jgi:hypothetical protein
MEGSVLPTQNGPSMFATTPLHLAQFVTSSWERIEMLHHPVHNSVYYHGQAPSWDILLPFPTILVILIS